MQFQFPGIRVSNAWQDLPKALPAPLPRILVVSGLPGAGKSWLCHKLQTESAHFGLADRKLHFIDGDALYRGYAAPAGELARAPWYAWSEKEIESKVWAHQAPRRVTDKLHELPLAEMGINDSLLKLYAEVAGLITKPGTIIIDYLLFPKQLWPLFYLAEGTPATNFLYFIWLEAKSDELERRNVERGRDMNYRIAASQERFEAEIDLVDWQLVSE